ncbi:MAG: hypothetical protein C5S38_05660 [Candidatus Methanophagaceae archaeon]|nr:MAG: hypothetical protein C5S38_05660 [Methanophagales archaeon]
MTKSITVVAVVFFILAVAMVGAASAKSSYVIADHSPQDLRGYNINADGTVTYSKTYTLQHLNAPTDVAVDESSKVLFVTGEGSNIVEIVDATTMASLGTVTATGANDLAGIEADNASNIVYTVDRKQCKLYAYDWNAGTQTLSTRAGFPKTMQSCTGLCGIALDETTNTLYAADWGGQVLGYDTNNLGAAPVYTVTPSTIAVDVAVDRKRQKLYTTCPDGSCGYAPGYNGNKIIQIDIATGQERHLVLGTTYPGTMGVAVEEIKGYVHFTEGCRGDAYKVYDPSTTPWTQIDNEGDIGDPAGLCIPQGDVVISDLNLVKTDITTGTCVNTDGSITYDICFDNTKNPNLPLTTVMIVDDLPPETTHVSGGSYNAGTHQATWNIGPVAGGAAQQCVQLTVDVTSAHACSVKKPIAPSTSLA